MRVVQEHARVVRGHERAVRDHGREVAGPVGGVGGRVHVVGEHVGAVRDMAGVVAGSREGALELQARSGDQVDVVRDLVEEKQERIRVEEKRVEESRARARNGPDHVGGVWDRAGETRGRGGVLQDHGRGVAVEAP